MAFLIGRASVFIGVLSKIPFHVRQENRSPFSPVNESLITVTNSLDQVVSYVLSDSKFHWAKTIFSFQFPKLLSNHNGYNIFSIILKLISTQ